MQEAFLHYIWQSKSFDCSKLFTTDQQKLQILMFGYHNHDAGPDFLEARVKIDEVTWSGSVEMHLKSSYWHQHNHDSDPAYENVILHVVWEHDQEIIHPDGQSIPCLQLKDYVDPSLIERYDTLLHQIAEIPCAYALPQVAHLKQQSMLERAAIERLQQKAGMVLGNLNNVNQDWEEVCYQLTLAGFGMKVNKNPMIRLGETLPYKWIKKHADQSFLVEALLFGQAGLLDNTSDDYCENLLQQYTFLTHKYSLQTSLHRPQWKFSRLRPANFPTIRLAQVAMLFSKNPVLFDAIIHLETWQDVQQFFKIKTSAYWHLHFDFGKAWSKGTSPVIGDYMKNHLVINVFAPVLVAASKYFGRDSYLDKAMQWLEQVPAESNKITRKYERTGFNLSHALDSQGCLALYYEYCLKKNCLKCNIGASILK